MLALVVKLIMSVYISLASGYSIGMNSIHSTKSIDIICVIFATLHRDCSEKYHLASTDTAKSCQVNSDLYCTFQVSVEKKELELKMTNIKMNFEMS